MESSWKSWTLFCTIQGNPLFRRSVIFFRDEHTAYLLTFLVGFCRRSKRGDRLLGSARESLLFYFGDIEYGSEVCNGPLS